MPRTRLSPEKLREAAIDATVIHMRRFGFERVRLVDVAKDLAVSHATLYAYFTDKAALLDAVTERWLKELREALSGIAALPGEPSDTIEAWFVTLYQMKRDRILTEPELYRALDVATAARKPFVAAHLEECRAQIHDLLRDAAPMIEEASLELHVRLLFDSTSAFHHPRLMCEYADEDREPLLRRVISAMIKAFDTTP